VRATAGPQVRQSLNRAEVLERGVRRREVEGRGVKGRGVKLFSSPHPILFMLLVSRSASASRRSAADHGALDVILGDDCGCCG